MKSPGPGIKGRACFNIVRHELDLILPRMRNEFRKKFQIVTSPAKMSAMLIHYKPEVDPAQRAWKARITDAIFTNRHVCAGLPVGWPSSRSEGAAASPEERARRVFGSYRRNDLIFPRQAALISGRRGFSQG